MKENHNRETKKEPDANKTIALDFSDREPIGDPNPPSCFPSPTKDFNFIYILLAYGEEQNIKKGLKNLTLTIVLLTFFIIYVERQLYVEVSCVLYPQ